MCQLFNLRTVMNENRSLINEEMTTNINKNDKTVANCEESRTDAAISNPGQNSNAESGDAAVGNTACVPEILKVSDDADACESVINSAYEPLGKYDELLYRVYKNEGLSQILRVLCYVAVALTGYAFFYKIVTLIPEAPMEAVRLALVCGVPFVVVSVVRRIINAPRPYELYPFYEKQPKAKNGKGFPSRHVFSIFVISSVLAFESPLLGLGLALIGFMLAACRVLLGIHFVRDTVAGAVIGITAGIIGTYLTRLFF